MGKRKYESSRNDAVKKVKGSDGSESPNDEAEQSHLLPESENKIISQVNKFDMKHFRKELSSKQGQTMVLTQFLNVCLNPDKDIDYITEYLKVGGNSHEILRQISQENKKNLTLATPVFHLFHLIIVKVQSSMPHLITITEEACRFFLNTFIPTIEIMISENSSPRHRKIILKLLTSMVTLNSDLGVEVLNQVPLTPKHLQYILEKPNYKEKDNVRTTFVHFMTSFLIDGHLPLIKALLEKQGLLGLVIPGLVYDEGEAVLIFLNILKKNVIDNPLISKTLKLKTFSQQVLHNMFKVFSWKGPPEVSAEVKNSLRPEIINLLTQILLTLFTSHRLGLYFVDSYLGTSDANKNQNLYKSLLSLKRPWENVKEAEVILQIVYKCPDLHRAIINIIEQSFQPQHSPVWERTLEFTIKLLDKLKPEDIVPKMSNLSPLQTANFVRFVTLPVPLLKYIQPNIGNDRTISLYCVKILVKMLQSLRRYIQILDNDNTQTRVVDLKNRLEYFLPKHVPQPSAVVGLINDIVRGVNKEATQDYQLPNLEDVDALLVLVELLLLYNELHPPFFESLEGNIDMKSILDYSMTLVSPNISLLKFKIVSLWLTLDNSAVSINNVMFKELFRIMLDVYTNDNDDTWMEAKETLEDFFRNTAIFEGDEDEIYTMLHTLRTVKVEPISLIGDIVEYAMAHKQEHTEFVRNQTIHFEISDTNNEENLETLFIDLMRNKNNEENAFVENKVPSSFIVSSLQYTQNNKDAKKNLKQFLSLYVANLLHCNFSPEMTEVFMGDSKLDVRNYVASWMGEPIMLAEHIVGKDNVLFNLSKSIVGKENLQLTDVFLCLEVCSEDEQDFTISDLSLKVTKPVDSSELIIWSRYLSFCLVKLTDMNKLGAVEKEKVQLYFECILAIAEKSHMLKYCQDILKNLFKNSNILRTYSPVDVKKCESKVFATKFLLHILNKHSNTVKFLDEKQHLFTPYRVKNYKEIMKSLVKIKKSEQIKSELTTDIIKVVGLRQKDDFQILNHIFNTEQKALIRDKEQSFLLEIVQIIIVKYSKSMKEDLPQEVLQKTLNLYAGLLKLPEATNLIGLEEALVTYFESKPHNAKYANEEIFTAFFHTNTIRKSTSQLASIMIKFNDKLCEVFKEEINRDEILGQRELTLPLGNALLEHHAFVSSNKDLFTKIYNEYKSNINKYLEKPHKAGQVYLSTWKFIRKLIFECMDIQTCRKLFTKIHKFETVDVGHTNLCQAVFLKLCLFDDDVKPDYLINYIMSMLNVITTAIKDNVAATLLNTVALKMSQVISICQSVLGFNLEIKGEFTKVTESSIWQNFCKAVLKESLKVKTAYQDIPTGPMLLSLLTKLIKLIYPNDHPDIITLFDMVTSHSEFLNVMLSHHSPVIKTRLLEILQVLISNNKSVMKSQQIPVFLSAYGATRSACDRLILSILYMYESNAQPVNEYKPYVWGDSAANYYAVRKNRTSSLWGHPTPNQVLNLFDKDQVERTVKNFPVTEKLDYNYDLSASCTDDSGINEISIATILDEIFKDDNVSHVNDSEYSIKRFLQKSRINKILSEFKKKDMTGLSHSDADSEIYDPVFIFSLLSHLLAPGSVASCFKLLRTGLLSVPVMALSSHCPMMRSAAYHVLHRFCLLLDTETKHKNDKLFLTDFVSTLRQSLTTAITTSANEVSDNGVKNPRLPAIGALYLARALMVSTAPFDPLYKPVNNFFIAKQFVDLTTVPDFLSLFHDSEVESAERRQWILEILRDGTKTMTDVNVVFKSMCLKMIMDFYSTVLCDRRTKEKILDALTSIVSVPRAFEILVEGYGLLSWLHSVVRQLRTEDRSIAIQMFALMKGILNSLRILSFNKFVNNNFNNLKICEAVYDVKIDKDVEFKILLILVELSGYLEGWEMADVEKYLNMYKLVSKKSVKFLTNHQMSNLINKCGTLLSYVDNVEVLSRAITAGPAMLRSVNFDNLQHSTIEHNIVKNLTLIVQAYLS